MRRRDEPEERHLQRGGRRAPRSEAARPRARLGARVRRRGLGTPGDPGRRPRARHLVRARRRRRGARRVRERRPAQARDHRRGLGLDAAAAREQARAHPRPDEARRDGDPGRRHRWAGGERPARKRRQARRRRRHHPLRLEADVEGEHRRARSGHAEGRRGRLRAQRPAEVRLAPHEQRRLVQLHPGRGEHLVTVVVRLFAGLREQAGWSRRELDVATLADVWPALGLGDEPEGLLYAVNREYAEPGRELHDGDEVALIPPVSGGAFRVTEDALSLEAVAVEVADERAGGLATFSGTVRRQSRGREVTRLEYEAYAEMAEDVMAELAGELEERYDLCAIAIHHRVGTLGIGEASVVIAVSAPHRQDALAACKKAIDRLKETVPLWKKEVYEGGEEWIGRGS